MLAYVAAERARAPAAPPTETVESVLERVTDRGIAVRVYVPRHEAADCPLLLYFHGGGWILGGLDIHDAACRRLANLAQCVVVNVDYRLAPEHPFPAAFEDCVETTRWAISGAAGLGVDSSRCAVLGSSSGGGLAAAVALASRDAGERALGAQVLIYPALDSTMGSDSHRAFARGYGLEHDAMQFYWETYATTESARLEPYVSPSQAEHLAGLPPTLLVTAQYDILHDEGADYAKRLGEAGVPTRWVEMPGQIHGFLATMPTEPEVAAALAQIAAWLSETL